MRLPGFLPALVVISAVWAFPSQIFDETDLITRADANLVGYLGVFFLGDAPNIYFYLSNGNNDTAFTALNGGKPILVPKLGTAGVRDPSIISGAGPDAGKKWFIVGTDLNIAKTTWDASQRKGSLSIFIWESTDLIHWVPERLVKVEDDTAGMVWAPDAIWDPAQSQYLVHWASRFYLSSDKSHTGSSGADMIRYAYTSDFKTFSAPKTFISESPTSIIDLCILQISNSSFLRFLKNETASNVYMERSDTGLLPGTWTRPGGAAAIVRSGVEGPYAYKDNVVDGRVNLLLDYYGGNGYMPFMSTQLTKDDWTELDKQGFPSGLRHGSVLSVNQQQYNALKAKWG